MVKIKLQLKDIPKIASPLRRHLLRFTGEEFYQKEIEEGTPFFSDNDLNALEEKYKDGMTKKDLISEIHKRGWQIKESTIKSYISKGLIPRALKRVKTNKGMVSIYPSDTIRHLNFTRYCLFSEDYSIKLLLSRFQDEETMIWIYYLMQALKLIIRMWMVRVKTALSPMNLVSARYQIPIAIGPRNRLKELFQRDNQRSVIYTFQS